MRPGPNHTLRKKQAAFRERQTGKYLCKGYGAEPVMALYRIFPLCHKLEILRVFPYLFHHSTDLFLCRNVDHPNRRKVDIHLDVAVTVILVVVVDFHALNQRVDEGRRKLLDVGDLPQGTEYKPQIHRLLFGAL